MSEEEAAKIIYIALGGHSLTWGELSIVEKERYQRAARAALPLLDTSSKEDAR